MEEQQQSLTSTRSTDPTLVDLFAAIRTQWVVVVLCVVALSVVALVVSLAQTRQYEAQANLMFSPFVDVNSLVFGQQSDSYRRVEELQNAVAYIAGEPVAKAVARTIQDAVGRQQPVAIRATIVVNESLKGTTSNVPSIISITATAAHPRAAAIAANQAARLLIERSKKTTARTLRAGIESVRAQIEEVEAQTRELERLGEDARDSLAVNQLLLTKSSLEGQLIELRTATGLLRPSYVLTEPATTPAAPTAPKTVRNLLVGAGAGLILGLVVGVLLSLRPHAKRTSHQVSSAFMDVPKLGVMVWPDPGTQDLTPIADDILYAASLEQARSVGLAVDSLTHDTEHACAALRSALVSANRRVKFVTVETRLDSSTKEHESSSSEPAPNLGPDAMTTLLSTHEPDTQVMVLGPLALCGDPTTAHILSMVDRLVIMIDARDLDRAALLHIGRRVAQLRQRPLGLVLMQHGSPG